MEADRPQSYGDTFAGIYDDWYGDVSPIAPAVELITRLAGGGPVLELGSGTGRLALPLDAAGMTVVCLDASRRMLERCVAKPGAGSLLLVQADMAVLPLQGPFRAAFIAFNTFFNLTSEAAQRSCVAEVARVLADGGWLIIEANVPAGPASGTDHGRASRADGAGGTITTTSVHDPADQTVRGRHVHRTTEGATRAYPWAIRYVDPAQLDEMCDAAGLVLEHRWASWTAAPFAADSDRHVSAYRLRSSSRGPGRRPDGRLIPQRPQEMS